LQQAFGRRMDDLASVLRVKPHLRCVNLFPVTKFSEPVPEAPAI